MHLLSFKKDQSEPIGSFGSIGAASYKLASGSGAMHTYAIYLEPNSQIGPHPTGYCQLFLVVAGQCWVAGEDGNRVEVAAGGGALFDKGEQHSKGSYSGGHAIMIQADSITKDNSAHGTK